MKDLIFWLAWLSLIGYVSWLTCGNDCECQSIVTQDQQEWIAGTCKERGRRTIIINEDNNQLTVKCKGPGVHLYDASNGIKEK